MAGQLVLLPGRVALALTSRAVALPVRIVGAVLGRRGRSGSS